MQGPYLQTMEAVAGIKPEQVDYVLCTHLHVDHVGWNTRLGSSPK
jgi:glyoxylase-like metal-dependent hydrolase (beta-lactamase superfamily II)